MSKVMDQTTINRGHLAFIEDQSHAAVDAFKAGELQDVSPILRSVQSYIDTFLAEAEGVRQ